jgi:hypothetical protein
MSLAHPFLRDIFIFICVVIGDEGCKVVIVVYFEDGDRVE